MRLDYLEIGAFKNLRDLRINFDKDSPFTVVVGENGAGKSNLLEAITLIFRNLDLEQAAPFDYEIVYWCRGSQVRVLASSGAYPAFECRSSDTNAFRSLSRRAFMETDDEGPLYRPAFVFGYYSGPSERLASLYDRHRDRYYDWIIRPPERRRRHIPDPNVLRRLFFAENLHGQFALIAFFMESAGRAAADQHFLRRHPAN